MNQRKSRDKDNQFRANFVTFTPLCFSDPSTSHFKTTLTGHLTFRAKVNCFIGQWRGKTNILDAIHYASTLTKSCFNATDKAEYPVWR
jgi:hypothetical protein